MLVEGVLRPGRRRKKEKEKWKREERTGRRGWKGPGRARFGGGL